MRLRPTGTAANQDNSMDFEYGNQTTDYSDPNMSPQTQGSQLGQGGQARGARESDRPSRRHDQDRDSRHTGQKRRH